ncbi:hypothetical protein GCM10023217_16750 [Gordonia alkaliphila]|uniref:Phosphatidylglycerol--prolipoprotein diacylglyceryl transferase n=1 Tax=Gordonia alkaliphila TaxID=1053547 RepID=A0ABP8Z630_9ACTN
MARVSDTTLLAYIPSPSQGVWEVGPFPLRAYALCIIVGIVVAVWWGDRRWRARGGQPGDVLDVALWAVPFGLIGGRLYHVATDWHRYFGENGRGFGAAVAIWDGGLGIWGAVAFGAVGAWIGCRWKGIKLPSFGDALAPAILLAQAIGRLGNYFNQELTGGPTTLPWGLELYVRQDGAGNTGIALPDGVSTGVVHSVVHPTFLYEMLWNILVVIALVLLDRRFRIGHGRLFALYVAGYSAGRFGIELLRTDYATEILGVRINVFTSAIVFLCAALYFVMAPRGRELGLSMYWPKRAEELAAEGELGYVPPALEDDEADTAAEDQTDADELEPETDELEPETDELEPETDELEPEADDRDASTVYTFESDPAAQVGGIEIREVIASDEDSSMVVVESAAQAETDAAESDAADTDSDEPDVADDAEPEVDGSNREGSDAKD